MCVNLSRIRIGSMPTTAVAVAAVVIAVTRTADAVAAIVVVVVIGAFAAPVLRTVYLAHFNQAAKASHRQLVCMP